MSVQDVTAVDRLNSLGRLDQVQVQVQVQVQCCSLSLDQAEPATSPGRDPRPNADTLRRAMARQKVSGKLSGSGGPF